MATDQRANTVLHMLAVQEFNAELLGMVLLKLPPGSIPKMMSARATCARIVTARKSVRFLCARGAPSLTMSRCTR